MSVNKTIQQFINANRKAYTKASSVFKRIESEDFASTLAEAGIVGADIKTFATVYIAEQTGVNPHPSQRGGELVFKKDSREYNRVKYLVDVVTGVRETRKAKSSHKRIDLPKGMCQGIVNQIVAAGLDKSQLNELLSQVRASIAFE